MPAEPGTITFTGPDDVPDYWTEEYTDEDGSVVPAHMVDMSGFFSLKAVGKHHDHIHGYTVIGHKDVVAGWPEMAQRYLDELRYQVERAMAECTIVPARTIDRSDD